MRDTKRSRIIRALKQLVLTSGSGVSRSAVAQALNIDLRTAAGYLEQLTAEGLLKVDTVPPEGGRGRPVMLYRSNASELLFLGLQVISTSEVSAVGIDDCGRILGTEKLHLPPDSSRLSLFAVILELVKKFDGLAGKKLYSVGLAISRWLQPPLAGEDVFANLADYIERECAVSVWRDVNINAVAFNLARQYECGNLAVVHLGKVIEFGWVHNGIPDSDFRSREAWLSHICVNPDGRRCYCGKYGCLENYVTSGARSERLKKNPPAVLLPLLGNMLGLAMSRLVRKYPVEMIILLGGEDLFPVTETAFVRYGSGGVKLKCKRSAPAVDYSAAQEALYWSLHFFAE